LSIKSRVIGYPNVFDTPAPRKIASGRLLRRLSSRSRLSNPDSWAASQEDFNASLATERLGFVRAILARAIHTELNEKILKQRFALQSERRKATLRCRGTNSRLAFVSLNLSSSARHESP